MNTLFLKYDPVRAEDAEAVELPLSKSIALRVMTLNGVCRAQGSAPAVIPELPDSEDVAGMNRAMIFLDSSLASESFPRPHGIVYIGEGGAPLRFFTALAASVPAVDITLSASRGLSRRPMGILLDALRESGADIRSLRRGNHPPLHIVGRPLSCPRITMNAGVSSQFISALMMAAPMWEGGLKLRFAGERPVSMPYIGMTLSLLERYGVKARMIQDADGGISVCVSPAVCRAPARYPIEPDWSAASYFYEIALLRPGLDVKVRSLTSARESLQGDAACAEIFSRLGVKTVLQANGGATLHCDEMELERLRSRGFRLEEDMNDTPDLVPALAVGLCLARIPFRFTSVGHLRHKETDRIAALICELEKLGFVLHADSESLEWDGEEHPALADPVIKTYSDHRMAMAFAPAAIKIQGLGIESPGVVGKSFPRFWEMLARLGFEISRG